MNKVQNAHHHRPRDGGPGSSKHCNLRKHMQTDKTQTNEGHVFKSTTRVQHFYNTQQKTLQTTKNAAHTDNIIKVRQHNRLQKHTEVDCSNLYWEMSYMSQILL